MASYKDPSFQDRTALARQAREKALKLLADKPAVDEAVIAERKAALLAPPRPRKAPRAVPQSFRPRPTRKPPRTFRQKWN